MVTYLERKRYLFNVMLSLLCRYPRFLRWMLAATEVSFTTQVIKDRSRFVSMATEQLPFGQLPLMQIDNMEIVQSQACEFRLIKML